jgi:hypothetical protein
MSARSADSQDKSVKQFSLKRRLQVINHIKLFLKRKENQLKNKDVNIDELIKERIALGLKNLMAYQKMIDWIIDKQSSSNEEIRQKKSVANLCKKDPKNRTGRELKLIG